MQVKQKGEKYKLNLNCVYSKGCQTERKNMKIQRNQRTNHAKKISKHPQIIKESLPKYPSYIAIYNSTSIPKKTQLTIYNKNKICKQNLNNKKNIKKAKQTLQKKKTTSIQKQSKMKQNKLPICQYMIKFPLQPVINYEYLHAAEIYSTQSEQDFEIPLISINDSIQYNIEAEINQYNSQSSILSPSEGTQLSSVLSPQSISSGINIMQSSLQSSSVSNKQIISSDYLKYVSYSIYNFDKNKEEDKCTICLIQFNQNNIVLSLPCNHYFHCQCAHQWLRKRSQCPVCRYKV